MVIQCYLHWPWQLSMAGIANPSPQNRVVDIIGDKTLHVIKIAIEIVIEIITNLVTYSSENRVDKFLKKNETALTAIE